MKNIRFVIDVVAAKQRLLQITFLFVLWRSTFIASLQMHSFIFELNQHHAIMTERRMQSYIRSSTIITNSSLIKISQTRNIISVEKREKKTFTWRSSIVWVNRTWICLIKYRSHCFSFVAHDSFHLSLTFHGIIRNEPNAMHLSTCNGHDI